MTRGESEIELSSQEPGREAVVISAFASGIGGSRNDVSSLIARFPLLSRHLETSSARRVPAAKLKVVDPHFHPIIVVIHLFWNDLLKSATE